MSLNLTLPLINLSYPFFSGIQFPDGWCHRPENLKPNNCLCEDHGELVLKVFSEEAAVTVRPATNLTTEQELANLIDWWAEGVILPSICAVGIIGNIASILVLTNKDIDLKPSFVNILICLAFFDLLFEILAIMMYCLPNVSQFYQLTTFPRLLPFLLPLIHIALTGSVYTTIAVACERCITVLAPFTQIKSYNGFLYLCPIILFSFLYNIPKFFEVRTRCSVKHLPPDSNNISVMVLDTDHIMWNETGMRSEKNYMIYITANCVLMGLLPMILLSILNWLIYRAISKARALHASLKSGNTHRRDNTMATVLTAIVFVFIVCHTPKAALNLYEVGTKLIPGLAEFTSNKRLRMAEHVIANVSHILIVTNSAVNIIVYAMKDFKFRHVLWSWFCGTPTLSKPSGYHHPSKKIPTSKTCVMEDTATALAISTNMVDIDLSVKEIPSTTTMDAETKVLTTDF